MTTPPLVSILIRARDQEQALRRLRPALERQQPDFAFEVWLIDNQSRDASAQVALESGWQTQQIPRAWFNYATSLNQAFAAAQGTYCVCLSAHCLPQSDTWLDDLVRPLREDPAVAASYGRQWFDPQRLPIEAREYNPLYPATGPGVPELAFSNANSAYRRADLLRHPLNPGVKICEDLLFLHELGGEQRVAYVPEALVHQQRGPEPIRAALRRWQREGWAQIFFTAHRGYPDPLPGAARLPELPARHWPRALLRHLARWAGRRSADLRPWLLTRMDSEHLVRVARALRREGASDEATPADWTEEMRLKGDWGFIRANIAEFIASCHQQGLVASPILEVGASGQNDYLREWYEMNTSNLATNMQGSAIPLDMEDMASIAEGSYGTVLCSEVIEHVRHPDRAIAEAFRILRPGGRLILTTPYSIVIHNSPDDGGFHGRNFTPQGLELIASECGFQIERLETRGRSETRRRLMPSNVFLVARKPPKPGQP